MEQLAKLYLDEGKRVVPIRCDIGAISGDGNGGGSYLHDRALSKTGAFFELRDGAGSATGRLAAAQIGPASEPALVAEAVAVLIADLKPPRAFYVRLLAPDLDKFEPVEVFFRQVVDPVVIAKGFTPHEVGRDRPLAAFMNVEDLRGAASGIPRRGGPDGRSAQLHDGARVRARPSPAGRHQRNGGYATPIRPRQTPDATSGAPSNRPSLGRTHSAGGSNDTSICHRSSNEQVPLPSKTVRESGLSLTGAGPSVVRCRTWIGFDYPVSRSDQPDRQPMERFSFLQAGELIRRLCSGYLLNGASRRQLSSSTMASLPPTQRALQ